MTWEYYTSTQNYDRALELKIAIQRDNPNYRARVRSTSRGYVVEMLKVRRG